MSSDEEGNSAKGIGLGDSVASERRSYAQARHEISRVRSDRASWYLLVGLLTFAPLAFGAVEYWSIAVLELLAVLLFVVWVIDGVRRDRISLRFNSLHWAALGFLLYVTWQILTARTADPRATKNDLILLFCYFLVLVVVSNAQWSSRWIQRLAIAVSTVGFMVALIGVVQLFSGEVKIYGFRRTGGSTFGPYVNHNHFAGFMEMVFPLTLGLLVSSGSTARRWRGLFVLFAAVMGGATLLSLSRGGLIGLVLGTFVFLYLSARGNARRTVLLTIGLIVTVVLASLFLLGAGSTLERLPAARNLGKDPSMQTRLSVAKDTLQIIREHPYTGTGLGTFSVVFPRYFSRYTGLTFDKAHNDYVELLAGVGLAGFTFVIWWIVALFRSVSQTLRIPSSPASPLKIGAFCGCFSLLIHSFVDFNLQIPANAICFVVLAALVTRGDFTG